MLSDVFIPMLDDFNGTNDPIEDYLVGLRLLEGVAEDGRCRRSPVTGPSAKPIKVRARIEQDRVYVHVLRDGRVPRRPAGRLAPSPAGSGSATYTTGKPRASPK